ncbi:hypothetical protein [Streptomyces sp. NPDC023838]|uniref:hypothetical protein n=1 Tax=Streptomyces sp. NPDC023838 TaxID=3154325 RepID=UPI0033FF9A96
MTNPFTPGRRSFAKGALAGAAALFLATAAPGSAAATRRSGAPLLRLPAPTGPYPVGARALHVVDRSRNDPWQPEIAYASSWSPSCGRPCPAVASRAFRSSHPAPPEC